MEGMKVEKVLVSVAVAASMLSVGRSLLFEKLRRGELRSVHLGARRLLHVEEIRAYARRLAEAEGNGPSGSEPKG